MTTDRSIFDATPNADKSWVVAYFHNNNPMIGVAMGSSFGSGIPALVNCRANPTLSQYSSFIIMTGSHEIGHILGLSHDGGGGSSYYVEHGDYTPIMGNGNYERKVSHLSKGEYSSATNKEDDIAKIGVQLGMRSDDQTTAQPLDIASDGSVDVTSNFGVIESKAQGITKLTFSSSTVYTNLDIRVKLYKDGVSTPIASINPTGKRNAVIDENLAAGKYRVTIEGDGELTVNTGFSDYCSDGYYQINGSIENHKNGTVAAVNLFSEEKTFDVYPNPNDGSFTIISPVSEGNLEIINSLGQTVDSR